MNTSTHQPAAARRHLRRKQKPYQSSQGLSALSPHGLYRVAQFCPSILGFAKTKWFAGVASGEFPAPAVKGHRLTMWRGRDILALAEKLASGAGTHGR